MRQLLKPKIESMQTDELRSLQKDKLNKILAYVTKNSLFYKDKFKGIKTTIQSLDDFNSIPLTTKNELLKIQTLDNVCVKNGSLAEIHFSSGTTDKPLGSFLTKKDIEMSNEALARTWYMQGIDSNSTFCMLAAYGLFSAGLINHYAIQHLGALIIPASSISSERTLNLMSEYKVDSTAAIASFYLHFIRKIKDLNFDKSKLFLKKCIAGGEPFSEEQRRYIQKELNVELYDQYGVCEINTGIAGECENHCGLHVLADYVYPEVVDPATGRVCKEGELGELVFTTLDREASPLIRYRTGDITSISYKPCACGRTMPRIARIKGRLSETLFFKGRKIEVSFLEEFMKKFSRYVDPFIWTVSLEGDESNQSIVVKVCPNKGENIEKLTEHIRDRFLQEAMLKVRVGILSQSDLVKLESSKLKHVEDNRVTKLG